MKTLPIEGTFSEVSFYEDDTVGRVRELIAIARGSHPDRLFLQIRVTLPEGYYGTPKEWTDLFFRLSRDGRTVRDDALKTYLTEVRSGVSSFPIQTYTKEQWDTVNPDSPIRDGGQEWHILGAKVQTVLPLSPKDVALPTNVIPLLTLQSLFETVHPYPASELRVTDLPEDPSDAVLRAYFPLLRPETPATLDASKASILKAQEDLGKLLALPVARHKTSVLTKAKWYIPLNATQIPNPRAHFEQLFYGLTLSETVTPYVAYFTSDTNALRSKFYVTDPKTKTPSLDTSVLRAWYDSSRPGRRRPTLLLYRGGTSRSVFQKIAITSADITIDIRKDKSSTATLEDMKKEAETWLLSLDAIVPSLDMRDLASDRWELMDMSLVATYAKEETEFDLLRFPCLQSIFGLEGGAFRLLRADQGPNPVPRRVLDACQALTREGAIATPEYLAGELGTSLEDATTLLNDVTTGDINCERALRNYPTIAFDRKDVTISFATDPDRVLQYADILRYVLTTDSDAVNGVCPRRKEAVAPLAAVPQEGAPPADEADEDLLALLGVSEEAPPAAPEPVKKSRTLKVAEEQTNTQNYFNTQLLSFNPTLFASPYSKECEKNNQVIILTPEQKETIRTTKGEQYTYDDAPVEEKLDLPIPPKDKDGNPIEDGKGPAGTAICPPYWCMTDLIPLREEQLEPGDDGQLHCPICKGKVRPNDKVSTKEYPVIKRETSKGKHSPFPKAMKKREGVPCCYPTPSKEAATRNLRVDETYILNEDSHDIPPRRAARLSPELAARIGATTSYDTTIVKGRLEFGQADVFRIGVGRPSETLPGLLSLPATIPTPAERPDLVKQCSFYSTVRSANPIAEIDRQYREKTLDPLDEVEYLSFVLDYSAILVDVDAFRVLCGFRTTEIAAHKRTIVILLSASAPPEVLGSLHRSRKGKAYGTEYMLDILPETLPPPASEKKKPPPIPNPLHSVTTTLEPAHLDACAAGLPTLRDAWMAVEQLKVASFEGIVDPLGRLQGFFVPKRAILPFVPTSGTIAVEYKPATKRLLHEILNDDLPTYQSQLDALKDLARQDLFAHAPAKDRKNSKGEVIEVETVTGFRIPITATPGPPEGVFQTVQLKRDKPPKGEERLVFGAPDPEGRAHKDKVDYESELYEFLLMSLASDIATDATGEIVDAGYAPLRTAIETGDKAGVKTQLDRWYAEEAYEQKTKTPYRFLSKVRTPCGQLKDSEEMCAKSSLCGWTGSDCKVQVRTSLVKPKDLLERVRTTLLTNAKQRALVLDNRVSRFFSTVLYLEMPNEWITTSY